jgi:HSP20 family protein
MAFNPRVDVTGNDQEMGSDELPGRRKGCRGFFEPRHATINGEKKMEKEDKGENYYRMERSYGSFQRVIPLSTEIEANKVEAKFKNGVLQITLPKLHPGEAVRKKIQIKSK